VLACERFAGRPRASPSPAGRDLIRACPPRERPLPVLSAIQHPRSKHSIHDL
jgi:hypothetical protein